MFDTFTSLINSETVQMILEPFEYDFMLSAFFVAITVSIVMAMLSCYIVLKGWSLMGDAIAHAVLPGIVIAHFFALPLAIGAFFAGFFCAFSTGFIKAHSRLREDTVMGVIFSGMFAIGIVLFQKAETDLHLTHLLIGDILGIEIANLIETTVISIFVLLVLLVKGRDLMLLIFDPQQASTSGTNVKFWSYGIQILLALMIVAALQAIGMILAVSLLIIPGACAMLVTKRFVTMQFVACSIAATSSVLGVYFSFHLDSAPGATIVLFMSITFVALFIYKSIAIKKAAKRELAI
jgi:manganese/iron transport system permease protein